MQFYIAQSSTEREYEHWRKSERKISIKLAFHSLLEITNFSITYILLYLSFKFFYPRAFYDAEILFL